MSLNFKPFDKMDWMGYGGAESAPDGREPIIAYVEKGGKDFVVIADLNGVSVDIYENDEHVTGFMRNNEGDYDGNVAFANAMVEADLDEGRLELVLDFEVF
jgi:hypothetical protein